MRACHGKTNRKLQGKLGCILKRCDEQPRVDAGGFFFPYLASYSKSLKDFGPFMFRK